MEILYHYGVRILSLAVCDESLVGHIDTAAQWIFLLNNILQNCKGLNLLIAVYVDVVVFHLALLIFPLQK